MEGMRGVPHATLNQKPAAIVAEMVVVTADGSSGGGKQQRRQRHGRRRWLGQWRTTVWSMATGDNVGQECHGMRRAEWRK